MERPSITDQQVEVLQQRFASVGIGRRTFLQVAAGLAAMGEAGFNAKPVSAAPKLAPSERLAQDQTLRYGGGGWYPDDPSSHDFNKDVYCGGVPALWAGLMKFTADFQPVPHVASKVSSNKDGSVWTFEIRKDSRWRRHRVHGELLRVGVEVPARSRLGRAVRVVPLRHQECREVQQEGAHGRA